MFFECVLNACLFCRYQNKMKHERVVIINKQAVRLLRLNPLIEIFYYSSIADNKDFHTPTIETDSPFLYCITTQPDSKVFLFLCGDFAATNHFILHFCAVAIMSTSNEICNNTKTWKIIQILVKG